LKSGSHVEPELFPDASVYFSDIVSFTTLASESSPMQVVTMLNDLYLMFDTTIAKFNVYKVRVYNDIANLINNALASLKFNLTPNCIKTKLTNVEMPRTL